MKIIDLLNKIANGEEVPKRIKYGNVIYKKMDIDNYEGEDFDIKLFDEFFKYNRLNDEVEILEEEKKDNFTGWKMYQDGKEVCSMDCSVEEKKIPEKLNESKYIGTDLSVEDDMLDKINEIIDYLKSKGE